MNTFFIKIRKNIWAYLICIFAFIIIWSSVFGFLTRISPQEKVSLFIGSYSQSFEKAQELQKSRPEYLKTVEINARVLNSMYFDVYLSMFGYSRADIMILPESLATRENCELYFAEISDAYLGQFENLGLCEYDGKAYGLKIHDKETQSSLISCINYGEGDKEENYYLFFGKNSLHISGLTEADKKNEWDGAIKIAQKLLEL